MLTVYIQENGAHVGVLYTSVFKIIHSDDSINHE